MALQSCRARKEITIAVQIQMSSSAEAPERFRVVEEAGVRFVEGPPDRALMLSVEDAALVVEACLSSGVNSALLYAANMTQNFFDLSSGEAGAILQKLRNYRVRLALVCSPGSVRFSSKFSGMMVEESRGHYFRLFESPCTAREWLTRK